MIGLLIQIQIQQQQQQQQQIVTINKDNNLKSLMTESFVQTTNSLVNSIESSSSSSSATTTTTTIPTKAIQITTSIEEKIEEKS